MAAEQANEALRAADESSRTSRRHLRRPRRRPTLRSNLRCAGQIPDNLRRVENIIRVPDAQRPCPYCGKERKCIDHDVTMVIELLPPEVIIREDTREVLACVPACCDESELKRAPFGDNWAVEYGPPPLACGHSASRCSPTTAPSG